MQVSVIGTGAIYTKYNSASTLVDETILVDIPNGNVKQLLKFGYDLSKIDIILLTHFHADHIWDMPFLWGHLYMTQRPRNKPLYIVGPKRIKTKAKVCFMGSLSRRS